MSIVAETINFLLSSGDSGDSGDAAYKIEENTVPAMEKQTGDSGDWTERQADNGPTLDELKAAAGLDWPEIENDPATLEALARAIQTRRMRERGEILPHYTSTTVCARCGGVPIFAGVAERVLGCPWCFNRVKGRSVPRPRKED